MSAAIRETFYDRLRDGRVREVTEEFFEAVEEWHRSDTTLPVWDWLGVTRESYERFVEATRPCGCSECRWRRSPW